MKHSHLFSPPSLYRIFILMMIIVWLLPLERYIKFPLNLIGLPIFAAGAFIAIRAKRLFKETQTPMSPDALPVLLHQNGLFSISRNPMYLGISIGLLGIALLTAVSYNLIFPPAFTIIMDVFYIRFEEKQLETVFGEDFRNYRKKTRRWI